MPRPPRGVIVEGNHHVICRSIKEARMFRSDADKDYYMKLLKKYKDMYGFLLYEYCLMGNHVHLMIEPNGANLSTIMHGINSSYAKYYNWKYNRYGSLLQGRFKGIPIKNDKYLKAVAMYIHNNPKDIKGYKKKPENYKYSSAGIYFGLRKDTEGLINREEVLRLFGIDQVLAGERFYKEFKKVVEIDDDRVNFEYEKSQYVNYKRILLEEWDPRDIVNKIYKRYDLKGVLIHIKNNGVDSDAKAVSVLALRKLCGMSYEAIARFIGDITGARISQLCFKGIELINTDKKAHMIFEELVGLR